MTFTTSPAGQLSIKRYEKCVLHAYAAVINGKRDVWTIGWGYTGDDVYEGLVWTQEQADEAFARRLADEFEPAANRVCNGVPTTQGQFDAMVSLAYNVGVHALAMSSVARWHRMQEYDKAADAFELYDHYHGEVNAALHERRVEEAQVYMDASPQRLPPTDEPEAIPAHVAAIGADGHQKAVVATLTGPSVGVLSWWANERHKLGIPEHVVADAVGVIGGILVWIVPGSGGWGRWRK